MAIVFQCNCGKTLRANDSLAGMRTRCPECGADLRIPVPPPPGPGDAEAGDAYALADAPPPPPVATTWSPASGPAPQSRGHAPRPVPPPPMPAAGGPSAREYLYLILALSLIPLASSLLSKENGSIGDRVDRAIESAGPEVAARIKQVVDSKGHASIDDVLTALPGGRLDETAHLPRGTIRHWVYAAISALAFWALTLCLFPGERKTPGRLLLIGLFTGTIGIVLLLSFQVIAGATRGMWMTRGNVVVLAIFYLAKFIGFSYDSANDPDSNVFLSLVGFTFGVGLCEEYCKAIPLIYHYRRDARMGWRGACLWGLASGAGFGVSEGIMYSARYYNGISPAEAYLVRFVSCVVLHAVWSGSVGIAFWKRQEWIRGDLEWPDYFVAIVRLLAVPMVLHGLYDTLLKKDMDPLALGAGVLSFAWFIWLVETARKDPESA